ncbi:MAG: serine/threonine-protein kinase, partial [Planctomycetota bacterium]
FCFTNGRLPIHVACRIAIDVCEGLQHAMGEGLVHRDIKPSNVMLYKSGGSIKAKILDFGLARLANADHEEGLTQQGTLLGTLEYIAPEQCLNAKDADIRSDIYSLGCTLYHMLLGHPPFTGTHGELVLAHSQKIPPTVNLVRTDVPAELGDVVAKMLAKQPARRFATPQDVIEAFKPFLSRKVNQPESLQLGLSTAQDTKSQIAESMRDTSVEVRNKESQTPSIVVGEVPKAIPIARPNVKAAVSENPISIESRTSPSRKKTNRKIWAIVGSMFGALILGAVLFGIIKIRTANGTIVIENLPEDAIVLVDGETVEIEWEGQQATITAKPGSRQLEFATKDGTTVEGQSVAVARNDKTKIRIKIVSNEVEPKVAEKKQAPADGQPTEKEVSPLKIAAQPMEDTLAAEPDVEETSKSSPTNLAMSDDASDKTNEAPIKSDLDPAGTEAGVVTDGIVGLTSNESQESTEGSQRNDSEFTQLWDGESTAAFSESADTIMSVNDGNIELSGSFPVFETGKIDFRNFHLRMSVLIDGSGKGSDRNGHWFLRGRHTSDAWKGYSFSYGGNKNGSLSGRIIDGVGDVMIVTEGRPYFTDGTIHLDKGQTAAGASVSGPDVPALERDTWHDVEFIAYGDSIEMLVNGELVSLLKDPLNRLKKGSIVFKAKDKTKVLFRRFEVLELGSDRAAIRYRKNLGKDPGEVDPTTQKGDATAFLPGSIWKGRISQETGRANGTLPFSLEVLAVDKKTWKGKVKISSKVEFTLDGVISDNEIGWLGKDIVHQKGGFTRKVARGTTMKVWLTENSLDFPTQASPMWIAGNRLRAPAL